MPSNVKTRKKLIEVALPLVAINVEAVRRKRKAPAGYPTSLHKWWAQRPLAAARAVLFAQMVDDPSSHPDIFRTEKAQEKERQRLFRIIEDLVKWENTTNKEVWDRARSEIWQSWRSACADYVEHPQAKQIFDRFALPAFHDPFAGGGSLPLEAQRLGLKAYASDLNPVAVLINKAMIEIPQRFAAIPPVNPDSRSHVDLIDREWRGAHGLAEDVRFYGTWIREQAQKLIGTHYPNVEVTAEMAEQRTDLTRYVGRKLPVVAYLWVRTVKSPDPAFAQVSVPLASTFTLANKPGKEAYVKPVVMADSYSFSVKVGKSAEASAATKGTKHSGKGSNFRCVMSGTPITGNYIKAEAKAGRLGMRLMAMVAEGDRGRVYLSPTSEAETAARSVTVTWRPDVEISGSTQYLGIKPYGMDSFADLFTDRQLVALSTFSDLLEKVHGAVRRDAIAAGLQDDTIGIALGGVGATAYAEAIEVYLGFILSRVIHYGSALCTWLAKDGAIARTFTRQALTMSWDFAEGNPFEKSSTGWKECTEVIAKVLGFLPDTLPGIALMADAAESTTGGNSVIVSTDPPYYDNVPYADLSDFFYVWLRKSLKAVYPDLFETVAVPKSHELVAFAYRHGNKDRAETFFLDGMTKAMHSLSDRAHPAFPVTIYYAFRQSESDVDLGTASTGWQTFLEAVIRAGFVVSGTWPLRTEGDNRQRSVGTNALASSIVLVCRPQRSDAPTATRREFLTSLKAELPEALKLLQRGNIAPVDLAQAAIGPGMAVYTRFAKVLDASGESVSVREALALINQVLDEALAEQEGDFDADTRWALVWFDHSGFESGEYGVAETLSKAKNTSIEGMVEAGILVSKAGKVRLLQPAELPAGWDPATASRVTAWEVVHQLIRMLEAKGETAAADLVARLGGKAEPARELAYRLYTICERKKRAPQALSYNALVQSWPEIVRLALEGGKGTEQQVDLFGQER